MELTAAARRSPPLPRNGAIQSVGRAVALLQALGGDGPEAGVVELSRQLGVHKSTVSRLLGTLERAGLVARNPDTEKYRLGLGLVSLAGTVLRHMDLRSVARPHLQALAEATRETVNLAILDGGQVVNIEKIPSPHLIREIGWVGRRTPLYCTSTGKVLLAFQPPERQAALLPERLERFTDNTICSVAALKREVALVRRRGYAVGNEEFEPGLNAIAAPIRDRTAAVVAVVSVSGPSFRVSRDKFARFLKLLLPTAAAISEQLGYRSAADAEP